jgi:hypothetical protein
MTIDFKRFAVAALLLTALNFSCYAEDAPAAVPGASGQAAQGDTKPVPKDVPRPSLAAKPADTTPDATGAPAPRHRRHYAHRHYRHYAYWEPFPVYFPHLYRSRITWNRVSWFRF